MNELSTIKQKILMDKARGLGLNVVHCLLDLKDYSPIIQESVKNNNGVAFVDRKGAKIEILPFDAPKEYHHVVIGRSGSGMCVHTEDTGQSYKTMVLDPMDQKPIKSKKKPDYRKFEKKKRF